VYHQDKDEKNSMHRFPFSLSTILTNSTAVPAFLTRHFVSAVQQQMQSKKDDESMYTKENDGYFHMISVVFG
jgi:hypothetical protein